ncbi:DUF1206 domain-containing protein [Neorhizobium huautlense]|uniref:DUF1206 domain-containing protein n=1 Tax=Neorhizobium huautlense TaxID=67774 RepID=UPI000CF9682A|nr:DUF1206 domain-containing protein [Neorhizobium huautlense]
MLKEAKFERLARFGYAARGIVYVLIGGMALLTSFGGGEPDSKSALQLVLEQPLGAIWLALIGIGLIGFVLWRLVQAVFNTDRHASDAKGYAVRAALFVSAATYASLAFYALGQALQVGLGGSQSGDEKSWAAWLIQQPFGPYLVGMVAIAIIAAGVAQIVKGMRKSYLKYFGADWERRSLLNGICMYGLVARGAVFLILGGFFLYAAFAVDPSQAGSLADALAWIRQLPFGSILYALVALGLFAFGAYGLIEARFRNIASPTLSDARHALPV